MFIINWITGWIIGWGGIGALVSVALWAAWKFSPIAKTQLLHAAVVATSITIAGTYIFTDGFNKGRQQALHAIAAQDAAATAEANHATDDVQKCFNSGGTWNVDRGVCDAASGNR